MRSRGTFPSAADRLPSRLSWKRGGVGHCRVLAERRQSCSRRYYVSTFRGFGVGARFAVLPASDDVSTFRVRWSARGIVGCPCPALELLARSFRTRLAPSKEALHLAELARPKPAGSTGHPRVASALAGWPVSSIRLDFSADHGYVEGVILSCGFAGVICDHLNVVRVVTDRADTSLDRAATRAGADRPTELGVTRAAR